MRRAGALLAALAVLASAGPAAGGDAAGAESWVREQTRDMRRVSGRYVNPDYGFEVSIPPSAQGWMSRAPNPNHGVRVILGPRRWVDVWAEFDALDFGSTQALLDSDLDGVAAAHVRRFPSALGGMAAEQATYDLADAKEVVVAQRVGPEDDAINFTARLTTTPEDEARDRRTLAGMLATFRHIRRVP